jgi:hypothetical protein
MAVYFCCTSLGVASTGRYPAPCPMKPGLSSLKKARPSVLLTKGILTCKMIKVNVKSKEKQIEPQVHLQGGVSLKETSEFCTCGSICEIMKTEEEKYSINIS